MSPSWLGRRKAAAPSVERTELAQRMIWRIAALLLDYPSRQTLTMCPELGAAAARLPDPTGPALVSFVDHLRASSPIELAAHYVETFDLRRRNCLHLSYYAFGDTRKRGMALLRFKHAYRAAGVTLGEHELPDHLTVVLEFAATVDPVAGERLLREYRPVMELLRQSLQECGSPYQAVLEAVCATLPELSTPDRRRIAELAAQGPPTEEVGLEPFAMDPMAADQVGTQLGGRR